MEGECWDSVNAFEKIFGEIVADGRITLEEQKQLKDSLDTVTGLQNRLKSYKLAEEDKEFDRYSNMRNLLITNLYDFDLGKPTLEYRLQEDGVPVNVERTIKPELTQIGAIAGTLALGGATAFVIDRQRQIR